MGTVLKQFGIGRQIEQEHNMGIEEAEKIALDHLDEDPYYYTNLSIAEGIGGLAKFKVPAANPDLNKYAQITLVVTGDDPKDVFSVSEQWIQDCQILCAGRGIYSLWERATVIPGKPSTAKNEVIFYVDNQFGQLKDLLFSALKSVQDNILTTCCLYWNETEIEDQKYDNDQVDKMQQNATLIATLLKYNHRRNNKVSILDLQSKDGNIITAFATGGVVSTEGVDPDIIHKLHRAMRGSKNVMNRDIMPQIKNEVLDEYVQYLTDLGYSVTFHKARAKDLKASQSDLNAARVARIAEKIKSGNARERKYITDKNGYILDGHHSWGGNYVDNANAQLDAITVDAPIEELIRVTKQFPKVEYEMI